MNPRRKFFAFAGLGALLAGLSWKVHSHARHAFDPARLDEHVGRVLKHFYVEIDATEAQKARLDPIVREAARDLTPLHDQLHDGRRRAVELLTAPAVDRGALESLRAEHVQLAENASRRLTRAIADASEVLTVEQRKTLAERIQRHRRGWHG